MRARAFLLLIICLPACGQARSPGPAASAAGPAASAAAPAGAKAAAAAAPQRAAPAPGPAAPHNADLLVMPTPDGLKLAATGYAPPLRVLEGDGPILTWAALAGAGALSARSPLARLWEGRAAAAPGAGPCAKPSLP
ncbi:hypothetical protein [Sorangium sp. So ce1099]|uniref:hypothetical protein n=1 Tax=Sorangium sp. So ce1099 TaxID=3133331 RepID=UPI003F60E32A